MDSILIKIQFGRSLLTQVLYYTYSHHKNNCLNSQEMSVIACYKSQKSIKSDTTTCEKCELCIKKFIFVGLGCFFQT